MIFKTIIKLYYKSLCWNKATILKTNNIMKWIIRQLGHVWCLFIHNLIRDKHKMHKAYGPQECQICGRWWQL